MYEPTHPIRSPDELQSILGPVLPSQIAKVIDRIDRHCRTWIERCPFIVVSSAGAGGAVDTSPKGDPPGFVKVLDDRTLAIPDRLGNRRGDTFRNVLENPNVGLLFIMPKRTEVLRIAGKGQVVTDPKLLSMMSVKGREPNLALLVRVEEAFFHCGKSMIRSGLWEPERWGSIEDLPSYAEALKDHGRLNDALTDLERRVRANETDNLY